MTNNNMTVLPDAIILDEPSLSDLFSIFYEDDSPKNPDEAVTELIDEITETLELDNEE